MKFKQTERQRANTIEALTVMMPSIPVANIFPKLASWIDGEGEIPHCGTVACFGGWCAIYPPFVAQGVGRCRQDGQPFLLKRGYSTTEVSQHLFGNPNMFRMRGFFVHELDSGTDHAIIMHRLQWLLDTSEVVA